MAIENAENSITIANVANVDVSVFHGFSPSCVRLEVPCISDEQYLRPLPDYSLEFLLV